MKLTCDDLNHVTVLTLKGDFAAEASDRFRRAVIERFDAAARDFVIDTSSLDGVDSAALESMLWLQDQAAERLGQVRLASCPEHLDTVLQMTRLSERFHCSVDVSAALASLE